MKLVSALDDLRHTTLCAFSGALRKLEYLAGLQTAEKKHSHWGLERVYGASTAEKTLNQEHKAIFGEILATPLRALSQEAEDACKVDGVEAGPTTWKNFKPEQEASSRPSRAPDPPGTSIQCFRRWRHWLVVGQAPPPPKPHRDADDLPNNFSFLRVAQNLSSHRR